MALTRTTKLEAVNIILATIGESPINSLEGNLTVDAVLARNTLDEITKAVLTVGWHFNTEVDVDLSVNGEGEILLGTDVIEVDVQPSAYPAIDPILMGNRLYDRKNHTFTFANGIKAQVTFLREFEDLPESVRRYINIRAARVFQDRTPGDVVGHRFTEQDEMEAKADCSDFETRTGDYTIFDHYDAARTLDR